MNVAHSIIFVCLAATTLGQRCAPRPKPPFNCEKAPKNGVFIPHPEDCTFLVMCLAYQPVVVSLCEENARSAPDYTLGCPRKCAMLTPNCYGTNEPPQLSTTPTTSGLTAASQLASSLPSTTKPVLSSRPASNPTLISNPTSRLPSPNQTSTQKPSSVPTKPIPISGVVLTNPKCIRGGIFKNPDDCKKALICASAGIEAIMFSICDNIAIDSSFPVGCPEKCPNWNPDITVKLYSFDGETFPSEDVDGKLRF